MATVTIELPISIEEARAEFDEIMRDGYFHPESTFDDYLEGLYECEKEKLRAQELGLTGDEGFELTEEGERILDRMWAEIRDLKIKSKGLNHWVYLPDCQLFTGVELTGPTHDLGSLETIDVALERYLSYVHKGPYTQLPVIWPQLMDQIRTLGEQCIYPNLEIYGHWNQDPMQCETTILIGLGQQ